MAILFYYCYELLTDDDPLSLQLSAILSQTNPGVRMIGRLRLLECSGRCC